MLTKALPPFSAGGAPPLASSSASSRGTSKSSFPFKSPRRRSSSNSAALVRAAPFSNAETRERERLKKLFREARERCLRDPTDGVSFTLEDFVAALDNYEVDSQSQVGARVKGMVFLANENGAHVDLLPKSTGYLPLEEASLLKVRHVADAGIYPGLEEEFAVIGLNSKDDSLILSLRSIQTHLAWERCLQLQSEDATVVGKVVGRKKGGWIAIVENLYGFVPFSQISMKSTAEDLMGMKLLLKFMEVNEDKSRLVLSHQKAVTDCQPPIRIGSVVIGSVKNLKPYGAFIDIGGVNGLLHVSQISQEPVVDITTVLQPGDVLKVMILDYDRERGQLNLSTKRLEPRCGDMIHNPHLVFEKAEEMAQIFMQKVNQAGATACCDLHELQHKRGKVSVEGQRTV